MKYLESRYRGTANTDELSAAVRDTVATGDRPALRRPLHPYLHWTTPDGSTVRGRTKMTAMLAATGTPDPPAAVEPRDGQIYRWRA